MLVSKLCQHFTKLQVQIEIRATKNINEDVDQSGPMTEINIYKPHLLVNRFLVDYLPLAVHLSPKVSERQLHAFRQEEQNPPHKQI